VAAGNAATLLASMGLIGLTTILPLYVQGVLGRSPLVAGFTLTALAVGWPLAATLSARFFRRLGLRGTLRLGGIILPVGAAGLLMLSTESHPALAGTASFVMGFGMGLLSITCIVLIQDSVDWSARGAATASNVFARSLGNTLGASVLGAILNLGIARYGGTEADRVWSALETPDGLSRASTDPLLERVLDGALHWSFWGIFALAALALLAAWAVPVRAGPRVAPA
jgi:MFS family permease